MNVFLGNHLWPEEAKDKFCFPNSFSSDDVSSQQECQQKCIEKIGCVGISYSHKDGHTSKCHVCMDDDLRDAKYNFGFYRRQGIVDV